MHPGTAGDYYKRLCQGAGAKARTQEATRLLELTEEIMLNNEGGALTLIDEETWRARFSGWLITGCAIRDDSVLNLVLRKDIPNEE